MVALQLLDDIIPTLQEHQEMEERRRKAAIKAQKTLGEIILDCNGGYGRWASDKWFILLL